MNLYRVYVGKKKGFDQEAEKLLSEINELLGIGSVKNVQIINRYYVSGIDPDLLEQAKKGVFSEPQVDVVLDELPDADAMFAVEYVPGQFDQRADSCEQCIQFISGGERPVVKNAKVYLLHSAGAPGGAGIGTEDVERIKRHIINPVESREAALEMPQSIIERYEEPADVIRVHDFPNDENISDADAMQFIEKYGLAMDAGDLRVCAKYFASEERVPSMTELRVIDTYWSDHCRHTTFSTELKDVRIEDGAVEKAYKRYLNLRGDLGIKKPVTLMDMATIVAKHLRAAGELNSIPDSEEVNACTVRVKADVDGKDEDWLFLFKNETHNHPTEIEPFGGAATCIGGAIRDPLSGRGYVYQAMRLTGAGDPRTPVSETLSGKLPQRTIVQTAAAGYSSYGNQVGLATGFVDEIYHPGFVAKRMEVGAVIGAAPEAQVRHLVPEPGDVIVLLGGKTGRDGCGGATGSSKSHDADSLAECGAEVQKGNAPEERKIQRLFRNKEVSSMIKRCNDFGAGGVSVAIGELAPGVTVNLDKVPKKYDGLDGTELAISESQERMAVVLAAHDLGRFLAYAAEENLEATHVADVTEEERVVMYWRGDRIVDLSRAFLNTNGAKKEIAIHVKNMPAHSIKTPKKKITSLKKEYENLLSDINVANKRGLKEMFDSTIGAGNLIFPFGGVHMKSPASVMACRFPVLQGRTTTCSMLSCGYNPFISSESCYAGANLAVIESISKLVAAGGDLKNAYMSFQEYFEKPGRIASRWGKPMASLMGAFDAQMDLGIAAIGGKDSMSGSFENMDVPPTLISFAASVQDESRIVTEEFKKSGSTVILITPEVNEFGLPNGANLRKYFDVVSEFITGESVVAAATITYGGIAERIFKMAIGNGTGFKFSEKFEMSRAFEYSYGAFVAELSENQDADACVFTLKSVLPRGSNVEVLGHTDLQYEISGIIDGMRETLSLAELEDIYDAPLKEIFPYDFKAKAGSSSEILDISECMSAGVLGKNAPIRRQIKLCKTPVVSNVKPRVLIPVFPGTNCEYDTQAAFEDAGAAADVLVINNISPAGLKDSVKRMADAIGQSQIIMIPGGFSGGDEPDGSGKFITAFFRHPQIRDEIRKLLDERDGLIGGICNGFQALIKLGLVPYGQIRDATEDSPTIAGNIINRHQSRMVRTKIISNKSPWLSSCDIGDVHMVAISHGEGRFICREPMLKDLIANGQIATQYVDHSGRPSMDIEFNPSSAMLAIEGITSPDGRVFGKMGHTERMRDGLYKNLGVEHFPDNGMFANSVKYFK